MLAPQSLKRSSGLAASLALALMAGLALAVIGVLAVLGSSGSSSAAGAAVLALLGVANVACAVALWQWRKWGFYGLAVASLSALVIGVVLGAPIVVSALALVTAILVFFTLPAPMQRAVSTDLYNRPTLSLLLLISAPLFLLVIVYLGSLAALLINSFFYLDDFTGQMVRAFSLRTYAELFTPSNLEIMRRTVLMAAVVTLADALLAFPLAYTMARYASPRVKGFLYLAVLVPLWSSYLVRVYSWKLILAQEGIISWFLRLLGLQGALDAVLSLPGIGGTSLSVSPLGIFIVFTYTWLPYMILPIAAGLERVPESVIEASGDLGAKPATTFWRITLPLAFPGVVAGSIFSFSLTLGDFIIPGTLGNSAFYIGQAVLSHQGTSGNLPLAAAMTVIPIFVMVLYLLGAKRLGAFDAL